MGQRKHLRADTRKEMRVQLDHVVERTKGALKEQRSQLRTFSHGYSGARRADRDTHAAKARREMNGGTPRARLAAHGTSQMKAQLDTSLGVGEADDDEEEDEEEGAS